MVDFNQNFKQNLWNVDSTVFVSDTVRVDILKMFITHTIIKIIDFHELISLVNGDTDKTYQANCSIGFSHGSSLIYWRRDFFVWGARPFQ